MHEKIIFLIKFFEYAVAGILPLQLLHFFCTTSFNHHESIQDQNLLILRIDAIFA